MNDNAKMGHHLLLNLFGVDEKIMSENSFLKKLLVESAKNNGFTTLGELFHDFKPYGFTGIILLSESHLALHTWPEHNSICFDMFSCSGEKNARNLINEIKSLIPHTRSELKVLKR